MATPTLTAVAAKLADVIRDLLVHNEILQVELECARGQRVSIPPRPADVQRDAEQSQLAHLAQTTRAIEVALRHAVTERNLVLFELERLTKKRVGFWRNVGGTAVKVVLSNPPKKKQKKT